MRALDKKATAILNLISDGIASGEMNKIERSITFEPVVVENIGNTNSGSELISVAHYYKQNGDLVPDPEMVFIKQEDKIYAVYFRNSLMEQFAVKPNYYQYSAVNTKLQSSITTFANYWLNEILDQQNLVLENSANG